MSENDSIVSIHCWLRALSLLYDAGFIDEKEKGDLEILRFAGSKADHLDSDLDEREARRCIPALNASEKTASSFWDELCGPSGAELWETAQTRRLEFIAAVSGQG